MEPSSKQSRINNFFQKLLSNPAASTPEHPAFLRRFRPIDALRRPRSRVRPCRSSPELQAASTDEASTSPAADENNSTVTNQRGTYKSHSLRKKLEVVAYGREHSEAEASRRFGVPRSTIYGWRNLDKEPIEKSQKKGKFTMSKKGKHEIAELDREQAFTCDTSNYSALLGFRLKFWILPPIIWASKSEMFKKAPKF